MRKNLALAAFLLILGGAGGYLLAPRAAPAPSPGHAGVSAASSRAAAPRGLTEADLQRVIRAELAATPPVASAPAAPAAPAADADEAAAAEAAPAPLSPAAASALLAAHERIDRALAARQWTQKDAAALTAAFEVLPAAQRDDLLHVLVPALNRGELQLAYRGPIFE